MSKNLHKSSAGRTRARPLHSPLMKPRLSPLPLLLLLLLWLAACAAPPLRPPGGDNHQWLDTPISPSSPDGDIRVLVTPETSDTAAVLSASIYRDLLARGYRKRPERVAPLTVHCTIDYEGAAKQSPTGQPSQGGPTFDALRTRWKRSGCPSCTVFLSFARGDLAPDRVVLWSDTASNSPVLSRVGHVRRTTAARGDDADHAADPNPHGGANESPKLMLDPKIAKGLRAALQHLLPTIDS